MHPKRINSILIIPLIMLTMMSCSFLGRSISIFPTSSPSQTAFPSQMPAPSQFPQSTQISSANQSTPVVENSPSTVPIVGDQTYINVYKRVNPSVVHIRVVLSTSSSSTSSSPFVIPNLPNFPGFPSSTPQAPSGAIPDQAIGSGFVYDTQGHIVTNNHVI
ncbi:MAG TPA: hypothetical protein VKF38_06575, partial [Anaerolineaceae bacterium]|nr:hypothetical protein [Anaerolineaceae bacterium]